MDSLQSTVLFPDRNGVCNSTQSSKMDQACLLIKSSSEYLVSVMAQSSECNKCPMLVSGVVPAGSEKMFVVDTTFPVEILLNSTSSATCITTKSFEEYGHYEMDAENCQHVEITWKASIAYQPLIILFSCIAGVLLLLMTRRLVMNSQWYLRIRNQEVPFTEIENDLGSPSEHPALVRQEMIPIRRQESRMKAVDVFRGISITLMIFVNYGGGQYWFFKHSPWNGLTVADLVFPWFLWIMGFSMMLSLRKQLRNAVPRRRLFRKIIWRSVVLVSLGICLNTKNGKSVDLKTLRIPGVLQRIGLSYLVVGTLECILMKKQEFFEYGPWLKLQDIFESWLQWIVVGTLTAVNIVIVFILPVPGCPTGYLGPGGLHLASQKNVSGCTGGATGYVDRLIFTPDHIYKTPTCQHIYNTTVPFDPEGLLGCLTSIFTTYLGVHAARIASAYHYSSSRIIRWLIWSAITGLTAGGLCGFSKEDGLIPVNKNLWSISYVLATTSFAFTLFTAVYIFTDLKQTWSGSPFYYAGMNPILLYIGHEVTKKMFPWSWRPIFGTHDEYLFMNTWATLLWLLIAFILYKKNIFITI